MTESDKQRLAALSAAGVSIWLDDLDRERIRSGNLADLVRHWSVSGVTTNPTIFDQAITKGSAAYRPDLEACAASGLDVDAVIRRLTTDDVRAACDVLAPIWQSTDGVDGRVSIEVDPRLAEDTAGTIAAAVELWRVVDRPNAMIKIPATPAGLPAITEVLGQGISVNVTLIFSVARYQQVLAAFRAGMRMALAAGHNISTIASVASFFISRVDSEVDRRLLLLGADHLRGQAGIANAQLAWQAFQGDLQTPDWRDLVASGARVQRPLWASTGVKDPAYPDTLYVTSLVAPDCVNTMPEATMRAYADHGPEPSNTLDGRAGGAAAVWEDLRAVGIDEQDVFTVLEKEGVEKFIKSWEQLRVTVATAMTSQ
jgi:transaldolase